MYLAVIPDLQHISSFSHINPESFLATTHCLIPSGVFLCSSYPIKLILLNQDVCSSLLETELMKCKNVHLIHMKVFVAL